MKSAVFRVQCACVSACLWVVSAGRMSAAGHEYVITYTDLNPPLAIGGQVNFTSGAYQGGEIGSDAIIWTGSNHSLVNLHPANWDVSTVLAGTGNQQVGWTHHRGRVVTHAAMWNGTRFSHRDLNPSWSTWDSMIYATTGDRQAGFASGTWPHAVLWSGTAASAVDLHPSDEAVSSTAYAMAGDQQGGMVVFNGVAQAALWSGTAASYRNLHPGGQGHSEVRGMTIGQQVGQANSHAGIWFGTAASFVDLHPAGAERSEARATIGTMQVGSAVFTPNYHAILWFGSAANYIDLQPALGSEYTWSMAHSVWSDGNTILVGGIALHTPTGYHPMLWRLAARCAVTCPTNVMVCADAGQCGAVVHYPAPVATNCAGMIIESVPASGSFFPIGTNVVTCVAKDSTGQVADTCSFQVVVRDCEPPVIRSVAATPDVLWPPNHKMLPVSVRVSASDNCGSARSWITFVTSNESADVKGGGATVPDWEITGDLSLNLRAERSGEGAGRVYTIRIHCTDDSGNASAAWAQVTVPHSGSDDSIAKAKPALTIRHAGPQFVVSWPTNYVGFAVEYSHDPTSTNWIGCADSPGIFSGHCWVTNSLSPGTWFFRLKK